MVGAHDALAIASAEVPDSVELGRVDSLEDAEPHRFLGSPTLRIDGVDVDSAASKRTDYGLKCRHTAPRKMSSRCPATSWYSPRPNGRRGRGGRAVSAPRMADCAVEPALRGSRPRGWRAVYAAAHDAHKS